ncbi:MULTISPECIES: helix-turn-helix transcriptional regulator [unclassified Dehalobacter]|uniref:helix-turn-helix domain-containing protein n=1 Tax=unclassified Dehalobacter TaxID=2635733 RepID=UPI000E6BC722|nr:MULTISPECIES: helix-turn-helix transcriptional regulator [unclassified Dehalobacter]RJE46554.1 transcriptional regulator [Dehalobacter sp. MCB1]TCX49934.1 XRE family transcriptional regulator [Dehalobacter sp. 14DCB1]TCX54200.1 XRE family transcriptional regulator [Dehalobacter sp. 12DCB1]
MKIDYKELGERIAKRRKVLNLTQDDIAEATGLSNNHISNIENNHSIPSIETLIKICEALDITPDYFLLGIVRHTNDSLLSQINQKIKLCDEKKLELVDHFITWVVDEKL